MKKKLLLLTPHPYNAEIYGDALSADVEDLTANIKAHGLIQPICINSKNIILSGHRRWRACLDAGMTYAECQLLDVTESEEPFYLIFSNKTRHKTMVQISNEIELLYKLYQSGKSRGRPKKGAPATHNKKTRDQIAEDLGISTKTVHILRYIRRRRPEALDYIGADKSITLSSAYQQIKLTENQKSVISANGDSNNAHQHSLNGDAFHIYNQDARSMPQLDDGSVDVCITSPPYFHMRYFQDGVEELGQEDTVDEYIENLCEITAEIQRVLSDTGSFFLNIGKKYKNKADLLVGERAAAALVDRQGWCLRSSLIWSKGNSYAPESTTRRWHISYEHVFWFVKNADAYIFDGNKIRIPYESDVIADKISPRHYDMGLNGTKGGASLRHEKGKIAPNILTISRATGPLKIEGQVEHSAIFPTQLVQALIAPVAVEGGLCLDPFCGSATVGVVAAEYGMRFCGYDINKNFCDLSAARMHSIDSSNALISES